MHFLKVRLIPATIYIGKKELKQKNNDTQCINNSKRKTVPNSCILGFLNQNFTFYKCDTSKSLLQFLQMSYAQLFVMHINRNEMCSKSDHAIDLLLKSGRHSHIWKLKIHKGSSHLIQNSKNQSNIDENSTKKLCNLHRKKQSGLGFL